MGSPLAKWLVKKWIGDGSEMFLAGLGAFIAEPSWTEAQFRNGCQKHLGLMGDTELKREAGISGTGTRIDLYAHSDEHDYLITMKKGLSQQKIKKVIGEIQIMLANWKPTVPGNTTHIIFYFFGCKDIDSEIEHLEDFVKFAGAASRGGFQIHLLKATETREELAVAMETIEQLGKKLR